MRKRFTFVLGLMLIICLAGCSSAKMAATISAPTEATIIYTDEQTGEEILATVEEEDLLEKVFEIFSQRLEDYYEELEEEEARKEGY